MWELVKQNKLLAGIIGGLVLIAFVGLFLLGSGRLSGELVLVATTPRNGSTVADAPTIEFKFNHVLSPDGNDFSVSVTPTVVYTYKVVGDSVIVSPSQKLASGQTYNVVIQNVIGRKDERLDAVSLSFKVEDPSRRGEFIKSLPYYGPGFTINYLSTAQWHVQITKLPEEQYRQAALELLRSVGVDPDTEPITFEKNRAL